MAHRIELFNKYTRPSIEAQTCQAFEWLLLGDPVIDLPEGNIKFIPRTGHMNYFRKAAEGEDLILLTRLDNDDMFMPTYVEDMQAIAVKPGVVYEFKGYRLNLRDGCFYKDIWHNNVRTSPFITLAQTPNDLKSVYCHNHGHMWKYFELRILKQRNWIQIIHDTNCLLNNHTDYGISRKGKECIVPFYVKQMLTKAGRYTKPALKTNVDGEDGLNIERELT